MCSRFHLPAHKSPQRAREGERRGGGEREGQSDRERSEERERLGQSLINSMKHLKADASDEYDNTTRLEAVCL